MDGALPLLAEQTVTKVAASRIHNSWDIWEAAGRVILTASTAPGVSSARAVTQACELECALKRLPNPVTANGCDRMSPASLVHPAEEEDQKGYFVRRVTYSLFPEISSINLRRGVCRRAWDSSDGGTCRNPGFAPN